MSKFDLGWRDSERMKMGLYWQKDRPTFHDYANTILDWLLAIALAASLLLLMGLLDARDQQIAAKEASAECGKPIAVTN